MSEAAVVQFSGGAASFCAAQRAIEQFGQDRVSLLFCDVGMEDAQTYDAVRKGAESLGVDLHWIRHADYPAGIWGRHGAKKGDPDAGLFTTQKMMGKPGAGLCSRVLKRETAKAWMLENASDSIAVIGMTWEEKHRLEGPRAWWLPVVVWYPMAEEPWLTKEAMIGAQADAIGERLKLYDLGGFEHANCGGACVKAGHAQWLRLLEVRPEVFDRWEKHEEEFRSVTGKDVSILRDRRYRPGDGKDGQSHPLPLRKLREEGYTGDLFTQEGSCGCFNDVDDDE